MGMRTESLYRALIPFLPLLVVYAAALLLDVKQLWGVNLAKFLPRWWGWTTIGIILVLCIPRVSRLLARASDSISKSWACSSSHGLRLVSLLALAMLPLWLVFRAETLLLGDGNIRINQLLADRFFLLTEMGDFLAHAVFYQYLLKPLGFSASSSYHIISVVCGVVFVYGAYRLACLIRSKEWLTVFVMMFSSGMTVMFFGYVESYSLLAALIPFMFAVAVRASDGRGSMYGVFILYFLAGLIHSTALVILAGLPAGVVVSRLRLQGKLRVRPLYGLFGLTIAGLALLYVIRYAGPQDWHQYFLSLVPDEHHPQAILTWQHPLNLLNWSVLCALPALALFLAAIVPPRVPSGAAADPRRILGFYALVPPLVFMFVFTPQLAGPRDWDLYAPAAFMLIPAILLIFYSDRSRRLPLPVVPATVMAMLVTISFAAVNASLVPAVDRFAEIIEVGRYKNLFKEYGLLYNFAETRQRLYPRRLGYALRAWNEPAYRRDDSLFMASRLANMYMERSDWSHAREFLDICLRLDSSSALTYFRDAQLYELLGDTAGVLRVAARIETLFPDSAAVLTGAAILFLDYGSAEQGGSILRRAYQLDSLNPTVLLNYGVYLVQAERNREAMAVLERLAAVDSTNFTAFYYLAVLHTHLGNLDFARAHHARAEPLARSEFDHRRLTEMKDEIERRRQQQQESEENP